MEHNWAKEMSERLNLYAQIHRVAEQMKKEEIVKKIEKRQSQWNKKIET